MHGCSVFSLPVSIAFAGLMVEFPSIFSCRGTLRANDFNCSGSIVTSMKACLQLVAFVNFVLLTFVSILQPCFKLQQTPVSFWERQCTVALLQAVPCQLAAQFTEKLELGWEEAGLICCRALPAQGEVTSLSIPMLKQGQCKGFFQQKSSRLAFQNRTFSKIKLLLRLAAFISFLGNLLQKLQQR